MSSNILLGELSSDQIRLCCYLHLCPGMAPEGSIVLIDKAQHGAVLSTGAYGGNVNGLVQA